MAESIDILTSESELHRQLISKHVLVHCEFSDLCINNIPEPIAGAWEGAFKSAGFYILL